MIEIVRKPISIGVKEMLRKGVKFVWVDCAKCGCKFEVTENRYKIKAPTLCLDCYYETRD